MRCRACGWAGDSIETYAHVNHLGVEEAIQQALRLGCLTLPPEDLNPVRVSGYVSGYVDARRKQEKQWEHLEANLNPLYDTFRIKLLNTLWSGNNPSYDGFAGILGAALRIEVSKLFNKEILPRKGFSSSLAIRYQDLPGRTCGILFRGDRLSHYHPFPEPATNAVEGGLTLLNTLSPHETVVYVMDDPYAAIVLLNSYLLGRAHDLKVVSCQETTRSAWHAVNAEAVYYRASTVSGKLFNHMKMIRNVHLTTYPEISTQQFAARVRSEVPHVLLMKMQKNSKPGYRFFADWLISDRRREDELADFRATAQLDAADRGALLDSCLASDRKRLEWCLGTQPASKTIIQRGRLITERSGAWYVRHKNGLEEPVTDAPPVVEQTYGDAETGKRYEAGYILFKGRRITFKEPREIIEKNPREWVESTCIKSGIGSPFVSRQWGGDLLEIAVKMHPPQYISSLKRLGYDAATQDISFPRFTLTRGKFVEDLNFIGGTGAPADNIMVPTNELNVLNKLVDEVNPMLASFFAGAAVLTANILAPLRGWSPRPLCLVSGTTGIPAQTIRNLAALVDAPLTETHALTAAEAVTLRKKITSHGWPHAVILTSEHMCGLGTTNNLLVSATRLDALSLWAAGTRQVVLTATNASDGVPLPTTKEWLLWLEDLQTREYGLATDEELPLALLWDFSMWWASRYERVAARLYAAAKNRLELKHDAGHALLDFYIALYRRGALDIERRPFLRDLLATASIKPLRRTGVIIDEDEKTVLLVRSRLLEVQNKLKLPALDMASAEHSLNSSNLLCANPHMIDGWLITREGFSQAESRSFLNKNNNT